MQHVPSEDGTPIALHRHGEGRPVIVVGGAFMTAATTGDMVQALADAGFEGIGYDRRARGDSGDTRPYSPLREVEDLRAVIAAVGGRAVVLGHSSGAVLALLAAADGASIDHLFLSEPPFHFGDGADEADLAARLQSLLDAGRPEDVVSTFQREAVGLPDDLVEQIRSSPMFSNLVPLAQSVVYDATLTAATSTPFASMLDVEVPVTVLRGEPTFPFLAAAAERLVEAMPTATLVVVPESRDHGMDPAGTARAVQEGLS